MASNENLQSRLEALEAALAQEKARADRAETRAERAETRAERAEMQIAKTTFSDFLNLCHTNVFLQLKVQKNSLLSTTGRLTRVDGKQYPCYLKPWTGFNTLHQGAITFLKQAFQQQQLFPSPANLDYAASKLNDQMLASEEDLKCFEFLAVEGCVRDVVPRFIDFVKKGSAASSPSVDVAADIPLATLANITFNYYPFGVVAAESDEEESKENEVGPEQEGGSSAQPKPSRGRGRGRGRGRNRSQSRNKRKPLIIKDDRPAYIGALGVAKRDMDAAIARAVAEAEEREAKGPPAKRQSPERTKVRPDQWCFRHGTDNTMRPLFVVEYKAAHKIDGDDLRRALVPEEAASLMEDAIRMCAAYTVPEDDFARSKLDIAKVLTQTFHYMVDYGLQYSYATTGEALIFLYLDPDEPTTLYYHLEEPKMAIPSLQPEHVQEHVDHVQPEYMQHSAVALVLTFVLLSMRGKPMTQRWKKNMISTWPKWPEPYDDMKVKIKPSGASSAGSRSPLTTTMVALGSPKKKKKATSNAKGCGDPQKHSTRRRDQDSDDDSADDDDNDKNNKRDPGNRTFRGRGAATEKGKAVSTRVTRSSSTKGAATQGTTSTKGAANAATPKGSQKTSSVWTYSPGAPLSPTLPYCTQACLLGLKRGGNKDPHCPNVDLHGRRRRRRRRGGADDGDRHPISAEELRRLLVEQFAQDMDRDIYSLEPFGMYGAIGALFKMALSAYGYCFVGKGVQRVHRKRLQKEEGAYHVLEACQGRLVPVNLGVIELVDEYWTMYGAHMSHMMLMSFAGESLWHHGRRTGNYTAYHAEMLRTLKEMEPYGVVHGDENNNNMVWNTELKRVMVIDFDHAIIRQPDEEEDDRGERRERRKASETFETPPPAKHIKA